MRKALRNAAEIIAGIALGITALAVTDTVTTSANTRLLVAVLIIIAVVYAEWGVRHAVHKARRGNLSRNSQTHNLSRRELNRRFRRG